MPGDERTLPKAYESHENAYRQLLGKAGRSWNDLQQKVAGPITDGIDDNDRRFLQDVLAQPWAPRGGLAVEFGCGTAPMLRWLCGRGFRGIGLEISPTAVEMARRQSDGLDTVFRQQDVCRADLDIDEPADLVLDGRCLHCLTDPADRRTMLANARTFLKPGGVFVLLSMCGPVDRRRFAKLYAPQKLIGRIIYAPTQAQYAGCRTLGAKQYLPTRYLGDWKTILQDVRSADLVPHLTRVARGWGDEVNGDLAVAALRM